MGEIKYKCKHYHEGKISSFCDIGKCPYNVEYKLEETPGSCKVIGLISEEIALANSNVDPGLLERKVAVIQIK